MFDDCTVYFPKYMTFENAVFRLRIISVFKEIVLRDLKVLSGEKERGSKIVSIDRFWRGTVALGIRKR